VKRPLPNLPEYGDPRRYKPWVRVGLHLAHIPKPVSIGRDDDFLYIFRKEGNPDPRKLGQGYDDYTIGHSFTLDLREGYSRGNFEVVRYQVPITLTVSRNAEPVLRTGLKRYPGTPEGWQQLMGEHSWENHR
jgi:hypothetical protein